MSRRPLVAGGRFELAELYGGNVSLAASAGGLRARLVLPSAAVRLDAGGNQE